jgi:hypothetical protein
MDLSKCCRARWIAVVGKLVSRGEYEGKGKGAQRSWNLLRPSLFRGPRNSSSLGCRVRRIGIKQPPAAHALWDWTPVEIFAAALNETTTVAFST